MPTYIQKTTNSDLSPFAEFNREISTGTGTDTGLVVSLSSSELVTGGFITPAGVPNSDDWEDGGTWTVEVEIDSGSHQVTARARVVRLDDVGTVIQVGSYTSFQILDDNRIYSPVAPTWEAEEDCDNRLAVEIEFSENQGMANSVTLGLGTALNEVVTDITEDAGGCAGGGADVRRHITPAYMRLSG